MYDNTDGTNANFTLTDSASNYEYLEIFFGYGKNGNFGNSSVKLFYEYQQSANLILGIYDGTSENRDKIEKMFDYICLKIKTLQINAFHGPVSCCQCFGKRCVSQTEFIGKFGTVE